MSNVLKRPHKTVHVWAFCPFWVTFHRELSCVVVVEVRPQNVQILEWRISTQFENMAAVSVYINNYWNSVVQWLFNDDANEVNTDVVYRAGLLHLDCRCGLIFPFQVLTLGVEQPRREADHSAPSSAEVKNAWRHTSIPPIRLHGVILSKHMGNLTFL
jgi:hypothetical protein